ncbi:MAG: threonine synthase [Chlorobi bacterium]|nr:threonine synthase [Chlorobiota bacterium]
MLKYVYQCINCGKSYEKEGVFYQCPSCSEENSKNNPPKGVLKTIYNYRKIKRNTDSNLFDKLYHNSFIDLLPVNSVNNFPFLKVGNTPLYKVEFSENNSQTMQLYLKDDSQNPTFSFKDRASYLVSAWAKEHNIDTIIAASTGNAGSSLAGICASQKQKAIIFVPASAPKAKLTQIVMYGAKIIPVNGSYDDAFDLSLEATKEYGYYNRNTAFNPFTIEGKKTVSFELFQQLNYKIPNRIFVPVGDGVIISGVYKGFEDLLELKIIDKMPTIIAVQAFNSSNIIRNLTKENFESQPSKTLADSIAVDIPRNYYMAKQYLHKYNGESILVTDDEILLASKYLTGHYGIFAEPAAAASFAGFFKFQYENSNMDNTKNVVLLTGSGLKDLNSVQEIINIPEAVKPDIANLKNIFED